MGNKKRILITGSGGFLLGNFIRYVFRTDNLKHQYIISSIDKVRDNHLYNIYSNANHYFHISDIRDSHTLHVIFEKERPDIVIHGAAETIFEDSFITSNVLGTQNVINECIKNNSRLIYLSSDKVYGPINNEDDNSWKESDQLNPNNFYAATKACGEVLIRSARGLVFNIARLSNNYGPWQTSNHLIPNIIKNVLDDKEFDIYGDGHQIREWTHVFDTCLALVNIIDNGVDKEIYNITSKQEYKNIEVAQLVCNTLGKGHELMKHVERECDKRYSMSNDKIKSIGWEPQFKFKDGIVQACQWFVNNRYGFLKI